VSEDLALINRLLVAEVLRLQKEIARLTRDNRLLGRDLLRASERWKA
jgi:hypothetical protein